MFAWLCGCALGQECHLTFIFHLSWDLDKQWCVIWRSPVLGCIQNVVREGGELRSYVG